MYDMHVIYCFVAADGVQGLRAFKENSAICHTITVTWQDLDICKRNGDIVLYKVQVTPDGPGEVGIYFAVEYVSAQQTNKRTCCIGLFACVCGLNLLQHVPVCVNS